MPSLGAAEVKVTACASGAKPLMDWVTWVAGFQSPSPPWLASIVQVPAPVNVILEPEIEHTAADNDAMVMATGKPEVAVAPTS